jgi:hydrophobic/amphiphilic exporter-1 (mainly G- bacteria), HAE1 family
VEGLEKLTIASTKNKSIGLNEVVRSRNSLGPSSIDRLNRQRIVKITGNLLPGGSQSTAMMAFGRFIGELEMGPDYKGGATGMTGEMSKAGYNFAVAFALAFIFMYIALAAQFESFIHPVTILITLPLAVPFGLFAMLVTGQEITIMSGLGLLLLFGIVKKNAILQIDHTNGLRAAGMNRYDAIIQANRDRLRPILMTTMALVCGMIPLLISRGAGASTNHSIGWMVAGGQLLCLALTLLAVPVFYSIWEDLGQKLRSLSWKNRRAAKAATTMLLILILVPVALAQAPAPERPDAAGRSVMLQPLQEIKIAGRIGIESERHITLKQAIEWMLENDPELAISHIALEKAGYGVTISKSNFDPTFSFETNASKTSVAIASAIGGSSSGRLTNKEFSFTPKINGKSPWLGTSYALSFSNSRQSSDSTFNMLNPQYPSSASLNLTQPLGRGLHIDAGRRALLVARKNKDLSYEQLRQMIIERVTRAVQFYWELVYAWQNLEVQKEAMRLAVSQYESNKRQAEQGLLAPIEVVAAQTQVATFQQSRVAAQQALTSAENNLKQMMARDVENPLWSAALIPDTQPDTNVEPPSMKDALARALAARPELSQNSINIEINKTDARYYKDQTKPQIDAVATLAAAGLAGTQQTANPFGTFPVGTAPEHLLGGDGQSILNLMEGKYPTVKIGVQISLPLRNHAAEGNAATVRAEGRRLQTARQEMEMLIKADVCNALEQWNSARVRHDAAIIARRAAEEQYAGEQRQFQAGTSTMFLVFQRQSSYIAARGSEVRARADFAEAVANLDRAIARTLETYQIKTDR